MAVPRRATLIFEVDKMLSVTAMFKNTVFWGTGPQMTISLSKVDANTLLDKNHVAFAEMLGRIIISKGPTYSDLLALRTDLSDPVHDWRSIAVQFDDAAGTEYLVPLWVSPLLIYHNNICAKRALYKFAFKYLDEIARNSAPGIYFTTIQQIISHISHLAWDATIVCCPGVVRTFDLVNFLVTGTPSDDIFVACIEYMGWQEWAPSDTLILDHTYFPRFETARQLNVYDCYHTGHVLDTGTDLAITDGRIRKVFLIIESDN